MSKLSKCILSILTFILTIAICIMFIQLRNKANELETRINYAIDFIENRNDNVTLSRVQDIREQEILDILRGGEENE